MIDLDIKPYLKKICDDLADKWTVEYLQKKDDLGLIRGAYEMIYDTLHANPEHAIPEWPKVEGIITDTYLDLMNSNKVQDAYTKRKESAIQLYSTVLNYLNEKLNNNNLDSDIEEYLKTKLS